MNSVPDKPQAATVGASQPRHFRFSRAAKLLKPSDFERVYKNGRRHFSVSLTAFYLPRADVAGEAAGPRIGITVGRVLGGAVERNRIKRRMREAIRLHLNEFGAAVDVVFNPKKNVLRVEFAELQGEVARAFQAIQKRVARAPEKEKK